MGDLVIASFCLQQSVTDAEGIPPGTRVVLGLVPDEGGNVLQGSVDLLVAQEDAAWLRSAQSGQRLVLMLVDDPQPEGHDG